MKAVIFFPIIFLSLTSRASGCELKMILAKNTKAALPVYAKVKETINSDENLKKDPLLAELSEPRDNVSLMYFADINNDGKRNMYSPRREAEAAVLSMS